MPLAMIRVKLIILPQDERLCVMAKSNDTVGELHQTIHDILVQYPVYRQLLEQCVPILELRANGKNVAVSGYYFLTDILIEKDDAIVVKLVPKSYCGCERLQPPTIELSPSRSSKTAISHKQNKAEKEATNGVKQAEIEQSFATSNIFQIMHMMKMDENNNKDNDNNNNNNECVQHIEVLTKLKSFALDWLHGKGDNLTPVLLNQLAQVLDASFPELTRCLKSSYFTSSQLFWEDALFIELGFKHNIDSHIRFSINYDETYYNLNWQNYLVFDELNSQKLWHEIGAAFINDINTWNQFGFGLLPKEYFEQHKQQWFDCDIRTIDGQNLVKYHGWHHLVQCLRNTKLMLFSYDSKKKAMRLVKREAFQNSIYRTRSSGATTGGYTIIVDKWLRFCLQQKIVPMALLKYWITESPQAFMAKKEFNKFVKLITQIPARDPQKWIAQRYEYGLESMHNNDDQHLEEKYAIYLQAQAIYNEYLVEHKQFKQLNCDLCDQIIELCLNDTVQGMSLQSGVIQIAEKFEDNFVDKFRFITSCINNTQCANSSRRKIKLLDQNQQMSFWTMLRKQYGYEANEAQRGTPDILLNEPIMINGKKIYWIDAKHWFVSKCSKMLFKGFIDSVKKYTNAYGPGAIICNGFQQNIDKYQSILQYNVTLLDGSRDLSIYHSPC